MKKLRDDKLVTSQSKKKPTIRIKRSKALIIGCILSIMINVISLTLSFSDIGGSTSNPAASAIFGFFELAFIISYFIPVLIVECITGYKLIKYNNPSIITFVFNIVLSLINFLSIVSWSSRIGASYGNLILFLMLTGGITSISIRIVGFYKQQVKVYKQAWEEQNKITGDI